MKITFIEDLKEVWRYGSMQVQYYVAAAVTAWFVMPETHQQALLGLFGLTADQLAAAGAFVWWVSNITTRVTTVKKPQP